MRKGVIDILTLALTHGLMAIAAIALMSRDDLDEDGATARVPRWKRRAGPNPADGQDEG